MRELTIDEMGMVSGGNCGDPGGCEIVVTAPAPSNGGFLGLWNSSGGNSGSGNRGFGFGSGAGFGGNLANTPSPGGGSQQATNGNQVFINWQACQDNAINSAIATGAGVGTTLAGFAGLPFLEGGGAILLTGAALGAYGGATVGMALARNCRSI